MGEPRNEFLYKLLVTVFLGEYDNPLDRMLRDFWAGLGVVGLIAVCWRLQNLTGWRGLLSIVVLPAETRLPTSV